MPHFRGQGGGGGSEVYSSACTCTDFRPIDIVIIILLITNGLIDMLQQ